MYALHVEHIERSVLAERQVAVTAIGAGAKGVTLPTVDEARAAFDRALLAEPKRVPREERELRKALGVA